MPKSSTETWTPRADRRLRVVAAEAGLAARARSVTSRQSRSGSVPVSARAPGDQVDQVGLGELARRQVDVDGRGQGAGAVGPPAGRLAAALGEDPGAEGDDQAGLLGEGDELGRQQLAPTRLIPADQRLDPDQAPLLERDDRLVEGAQLVGVDRLAQGLLQLQALDQLGPDRLVEQLVDAAAAVLGPLEGGVGVRQQRLGPAGARPGQGDADAGRDDDLLPADGERGGQPGGHPLGQADRVPLVGQVGAEDGELVAAEAGHGVAGAQDAAQPAGHRDQQPVDGVVAEALGHLLEAVEVDHQHGGQGGLTAQAGHGHLQPVQEQAAVGQPGQGVMGGPPGQLVLGAAALAQVDQLADHVAGPSLAVQVQRVAVPGGGQPGVAEHRDRLPVDPPAALLELVAGRLARRAGAGAARCRCRGPRDGPRPGSRRPAGPARGGRRARTGRVDLEEAAVGADHGGGQRGGGQGAPDPLQLVAGQAVQPPGRGQGHRPEGPPADLAQGRHQLVGVDVLVQAGVGAQVEGPAPLGLGGGRRRGPRPGPPGRGGAARRPGRSRRPRACPGRARQRRAPGRRPGPGSRGRLRPPRPAGSPSPGGSS